MENVKINASVDSGSSGQLNQSIPSPGFISGKTRKNPKSRTRSKGSDNGESESSGKDEESDSGSKQIDQKAINKSLESKIDSMMEFMKAMFVKNQESQVVKNSPQIGDSNCHKNKESDNRGFEMPTPANRTMLDGTIGLNDLMRMGDHDEKGDFPSAFSTIKKVNFHHSGERGDRDDRAEIKPKGTRVSDSSRAQSIEGLPHNQYTEMHQLHHPYINGGMFPPARMEIYQGPDFSKLDLVLDSDSAKAASEWLKKVAKVQALYPSCKLPIWALLSINMQMRVRALFWDHHKYSLDMGRSHLLDLPTLMTVLRSAFYPKSVVMFVSLFKKLVGDEHLKLLPAGYRPSYQNFQPMIKVVSSIVEAVDHALALILGDQERCERDVSNKVLPALDAKGHDKSSPGFMKIWCELFPYDFGWYVHERVLREEGFGSIETYEGYMALWLQIFEVMRKKSEDILAENVTMHYYTDSKSPEP